VEEIHYRGRGLLERTVAVRRVLHLIKTLGLGGAETNLLNLVRAFDPARVENHIGYSHGGEIEASFLRAGVRLFKYAEQSHKIKSPATALIVARLASYVRKNRIDIIHTHSFNAHVWGLLAAKLTGARVVEHVHDFRYMEADDFKKRRGAVSQFAYSRFFKGWSDRVVVLTRGNVDYLLKHRFYPPEKVSEIQNGIPMEAHPARDETLRKKLGVPEQARMILTPARFAPEKNIDLILDVAPQVLASFPQACFVIAGDGPLFEDCKRRVRENGLERGILFPGFYEDVRGLLSISDVFLLPSMLELHSIAILEAISMGVPAVISSGVGCNSEVFTDKKNAFLLDPFSHDGWAQALISLLGDENKRAAIAEAGHVLCREKFEIAVVARKFEELYAGISGR